jgi:hypothetical protein
LVKAAFERMMWPSAPQLTTPSLDAVLFEKKFGRMRRPSRSGKDPETAKTVYNFKTRVGFSLSQKTRSTVHGRSFRF